MTSRVQKGVAIFRPVAKSRGPRQASVVAESPAIPSLVAGPSRSQPSEAAPPSIPLTNTDPIQLSEPPPLTSSRTGTPINAPQLRPPTLPTHTSAIPTLGSPISIIPGIASRAHNKPVPTSGTSVIQPEKASQPIATPISIPTPHTPSSTTVPPLNETNPQKPPSRSAAPPERVTIHPQATPTSVAVDTPSSTVQTPAPPKPTKKRKHRPRSTSATGTDEDGQDENEPSSRGDGKRKRASSTPRSRRSRGSSLPPFDPNADPGEDLDPTAVTMASLCEDTGQGRVSSKAVEILSNHVAWKAQNRIKRVRMKALMEAKKYGREEEFERESGSASQSPGKGNVSPSASGPTDQSPSDPSPGNADSSLNGNSPAVNKTNDNNDTFDYTQDLETSRFNVQVRIGPNGETIIDENTLVVDRTEPEDTSDYTHVVESDQTKFVNSGTYSKRYRGSRWSAEETEMFYNALSQYGENYELIAYVLPGRDRKSCKNKFKAEDKKNPARINYCLRNSMPVDMETLSKMTGKDFSGPVPEIRARPVPQLVPAAEGGASGSTETRDSPAPPDSSSRRKSRVTKKISADEEGVIVIGNVDTFDNPDV